MNTLYLTETQDTPQVTLNKNDGIFELVGRSLPEDSVEFYSPVLQWIREYAKAPNPATAFHFKLEYFNTSSSKLILDLLHELKHIKNITVFWHYNQEDESMDEAGHEYAEQVEIPFKFEVLQ
jgi:hypothetical protein